MPPSGASQLHGFTLYNVTVRNFDENGVFLEYVRDFLIAKTTTIDNGEYGVYPVHSSHGIVYQCDAYGHADSGIYIGQSKRVWLLDNLATGNVIGIEIENCAYVVAAHNTARENTAGIMAILLPPNDHVTVTYADDIYLLRNRVSDNNLENFAHPTELAAFVPQGSGILVVGQKNSSVTDNVVTGNDFAGIATASTLLLGSLAGIPAVAFEAIDPDPQSVTVAYNTVLNNGANPPDLPAPLAGVGVDLLWDGSGMDNCWHENRYESSFPLALPACDHFPN
jgi:parallel beta-helix repeat protein